MPHPLRLFLPEPSLFSNGKDYAGHRKRPGDISPGPFLSTYDKGYFLAAIAFSYPMLKAFLLSSRKASGTRASTAFSALSLVTTPLRATMAPRATMLATISRPTSFLAVLMIG